MRIKSFQGLRGIAALSVAICHFLAAFIPTSLYGYYPTLFSENSTPSFLFEALTSPIIGIFYNGVTAVMIFFVMSGYVLTLPFFTKIKDYEDILKKGYGVGI